MKNNNEKLLIVLVVEDEWLLRACVADYLQDAGCVVVEAETAERAVALCEIRPADRRGVHRHQPAGRLDGWDVGEAARAARGDPVLYTSGSTIEQARPVPGSRFFHKPYRPADILARARRFAADQETRRATPPVERIGRAGLL